MLTVSKNSLSDEGLLCFLKRNPSLSNSLFAGCAQDIREVTTIIEPVLQTSQRCQSASFYIHAVSLGETGFLATNLSIQGSEKEQDDPVATETASSWLIGRGSTCILSLLDSSVSRCHAVISHLAYAGFFITDVGSTNGTWVNHSKIPQRTRHALNDGDLLQLGNVKVEFFISDRHQKRQSDPDSLCYLTTMPG